MRFFRAKVETGGEYNNNSNEWLLYSANLSVKKTQLLERLLKWVYLIMWKLRGSRNQYVRRCDLVWLVRPSRAYAHTKREPVQNTTCL